MRSQQFDVLRSGTRIARLDKKKIFIVNVPKICLKLRLLFDVDFHGESGTADES